MRTVLVMTVVVILLAGGMVSIENAIKEQAEVIQEQNEIIEGLVEEKEGLVHELQELQERVESLEERWSVGIGEITTYAPLCPTAVEGMCYEGNPNTTYSGEQVVIGETVAAGPDVPIGTKVWIEGFGWRKVTDRGGAIGPGDWDVAVESRQEAMRFGRQERVVIMPKK